MVDASRLCCGSASPAASPHNGAPCGHTVHCCGGRRGGAPPAPGDPCCSRIQCCGGSGSGGGSGGGGWNGCLNRVQTCWAWFMNLYRFFFPQPSLEAVALTCTVLAWIAASVRFILKHHHHEHASDIAFLIVTPSIIFAGAGTVFVIRTWNLMVPGLRWLIYTAIVVALWIPLYVATSGKTDKTSSVGLVIVTAVLSLVTSKISMDTIKRISHGGRQNLSQGP